MRYSYSQLSTYAACPTKYKLRYVDHLSPLAESDHDLRFGKAWDAALNALYSSIGNINRAEQAFATSYPKADYPAQLPYWSLGKSFTNGIAAISAYVDNYREEDQNWEVVSIQSRDTQEDEEHTRTVVLDLVIRDKRDGLIYGCDNKTTGKYLDQQFFLQFDPHSQIRQYVDHLQKKFGEVGGFYINAAGFRHRSKAYTPRSGPDKGIQLPAGDWHTFKRMVFNPNRNALGQELSSYQGWVAKIESDRASGLWTYNTEQCVKGPIICPYHKICSAGYEWPADSELISEHYLQRCPKILETGVRCWLSVDHEGEHDSTKPEFADAEVDLNEEIEDAVY